MTKNQANAKQDTETERLLFENYSYSSSTLSSKNKRTYSENKQKNKCVFTHVIIQLFIMETKMKIKNISHRYDINRHRPRYGHKYSKYKKCLSMMLLICIKEHLSNIWSSVYEKVKHHWGWVEQKPWL